MPPLTLAQRIYQAVDLAVGFEGICIETDWERIQNRNQEEAIPKFLAGWPETLGLKRFSPPQRFGMARIWTYFLIIYCLHPNS
jgi:hypothetical protein